MEIFKYLAEQGTLRGVVGYEDGQMVAVYLCTVSPCIFSKNTPLAQECLWALGDSHRNIKNLNRLLREIDKLHIQYNVAVSQICMHNTRAEKLMTKHDYILEEHWYFKEYR
jgi:hypothetical protein